MTISHGKSAALTQWAYLFHNDRSGRQPVPTEECIDNTFHLWTYFVQKFFSASWLATSLDEAIEQTRLFFDEYNYSDARNLLECILRVSSEEIGSESPSDPLFFRVNEHFVRLDVCSRKGIPCTFDDPDVQASCGTLYLNGERLKRNPERAITWLEKAAKQKNVYALFTLARLYIATENSSFNPDRAVMLLGQAAEQGDSDSAELLAGLYDDSNIVPPDYRRAAKWAQFAAIRGSGHAQGHLGLLYATGKGVTQDITEGYAWSHLSADAGNQKAQTNVSLLARRMSPDQLAKATARARELKLRISQQR